MKSNRVSPLNHDVREMAEDRKKARKAFDRRGETIAQWSIKKGFNPVLVSAVLHGKLKCARGSSHKIAVELGLKPEVMAA